MDDGVVMDKLQAQTSVQSKDLGELFEYNISKKVSIKRKHSALVPILTEEISAKKLLLYNKNDHDKNPNACLEITNNTALTLERGPVTIIYDENLAGEAIIPFLNKDDTRLLNYAVEQAVVINHDEITQSKKVHRISFSGAYCYEYYYTDLRTNYKIKNKTTNVKELYLDHPKKSGYKIEDSPIEPEETPNYWRFKIELKPKDAINFNIRERYENYSSYYLWNYSKDNILKKVSLYIRKQFIDAEVEAQLKDIGEQIGKRNELTEKKEKLENERYQMEDEQSRLRENIRVLGDTTHENTLREKYVKKLGDQEERFETITQQIKQLTTEIDTLYREIEEKIEILSKD